ncbi:nuclear transport factor 2 family protein [Shewanella sp. AS1]|uniref:YybH family protein n=1 Tax=Shewanella sp. AS1 TaxID=2907626 RepID=UPI001F488C6C|nr:nuclear transport factor 2 family protein [Shewanella sp. AS1]MCE9678538.1 nuclear transport factor 2 family protein [Shewanella sp. AS1]
MKLTKLMVIAIIAGLVSSLFLPMMAQAKTSDDDALNQFYAQFTVAFERLDVEIIKTIYAENACYIPEQQSKDITIGRDKIIALYNAFFSKIKNKNAHIEVDFRVIERQISQNSATDIGYYMIRYHPPKETEEPVSEFAGKFVNVSKKKNDGKWYLTVDTNNRAEPDFYYQAKPTPNLYFGLHFSKTKHN